MAIRTVVCPECDEPVPYGRLSCASCGSLLASVTGAPRRTEPLRAVAFEEEPTLVPEGEEPPEPEPEPEPEASAEPVAAQSQANWEDDSWIRGRAEPARDAEEEAGRERAAEPEPAPWAAAEPAPWAAEPEPESAPWAAGEPEPAPWAAAEPAPWAAAEPEPDPEPAGAPGAAPADLDDAAEPAPPEVEAVPDDEPLAPDDEPAAPVDEAPSAAAEAWAAAAPEPAPEVAPLGMPDVLKDWTPLPPPPDDDEPLTHPSAPTARVEGTPHPWANALDDNAAPVLYPSAVRPSDSAVPAGAWVPPSAAPAAAAPSVAPSVAKPARKPRPGDAPLLADLPFDAPDDLAGWIVTIGSAIGIVGFLLPWSDRVPFTAGSGYMDRWGLATPANWLVLGATVFLLILSLQPGRIPAWVRLGAVPLALGGLLLGITWPYLLGGFGAQIGALSVGLSAILLVVGGSLALRHPRHGGAGPGV